MADQMNEDNGGIMPEDQVTPEENQEQELMDSSTDQSSATPEPSTEEQADPESVSPEIQPEPQLEDETMDDVEDETEGAADEMAEDESEPESEEVAPEVVEPLADEDTALELQSQGEEGTESDQMQSVAVAEAEPYDLLTLEPEPEPEAEEQAESVLAPADEPDDGRLWYVLHCYSGYENKVRHNLEQRIETMGMKDRIFDVVVPTEEEIEVKDGKRKTVERRVFPGYILVNMVLSEESWYVVRNTPGVTSFVGQGNEPLPLRPEEVATIIKRMEADAPRIKVTFRQGERVRIVDGPFNDFRGTVDEIDMERAKVRVMVNFFGRETPVELDFLQVEKA